MEIKPLTGAFGAEVLDVDLKSGISAEQSGMIEAALAENVVLIFRNQDLDIDGFESFAASIGDFGETPFITPFVLGFREMRSPGTSTSQRIQEKPRKS